MADSLIDFFLPVKVVADIVRILIDKKVYTFSLKDADWSGLAVTDWKQYEPFESDLWKSRF